MKYIITESQFELLSELERGWMDSEYESQYDKLKDRLIPLIKNLFESYSENDNHINLLNKDNEVIVTYNKKSKELFFDRSIDEIYSDLFPHPIWMVSRKYLMSDVFESFFPNQKVRRVQCANFGRA
jgi:hypothetical protein